MALPWQRLPELLQLSGSVFEIAGVVLMANGLIGAVDRRGVVRTLLDALRRGPRARGAVRMRELTPEDGLRALQGLAFVLVGFLLQATGTLAAIAGSR